MYSEDLREKLEQEDIEIGDRIKVNGKEGRLMPKPKTGDSNIIVLKQDNGYNIGLEPEEINLIEKKAAEETGIAANMDHSDEKKDILVLHTGGTIASRVSYETGGVKASFKQEDMLQMYPEIIEEANIHSDVYVGKIMSEDMEPAHWKGIAEKIDQVKDQYDGIVVGHGTDTMSYTGAALTFMLKGIDTGVLLVGAQRSSDRPSTDARMNMYCATKFLSETSFTGVGVCMHKNSSDDVCHIIPAAKSRKMHTSRRDAFQPINSGIYAEVDYEEDVITEGGVDWPIGEEYQLRTGISSNIGYLKTRPGMDPEELDFLLEQDYEGVIIEGTGLGHMPASSFDEHTGHHEEILDKLSELSEESVVAITSQCINGRVNQTVYDNLLKVKNAGVVGSKDMHPELAYVKLAWSIGNTDSRDDALELFQKDINGEITERSMIR